MSKGSKTNTVTNTTDVPAYVQEAQQNYLNTVGNFTMPFLAPPTASTVAGMTPNQTYAGDLSRQMAANEAVLAPITYLPQWNPTQYYNPASSGNPALMPATNAGYAATTDPNAGQVGGGQISALLNPYTKDVLDPTIALMRRELGKTQAQIGARNASSAAFGGSREALQSSEANRAFGDQVALTTAQLMSQGFDRATATALANAGQAQQAGMFNAGQTNQQGQFNATLADRANAINQAAINNAAEANAQREQQAAAANAAAGNNMQQFNSNTFAQAPQIQNTLANSEAERMRSALAQLFGIGTVEQQTNQAALSEPTNMLKLLGSAIPGNYGQTSTQTTPTQSNSIESALGLVGVGQGLFGSSGLFPKAIPAALTWFAGSSDRRDKTDIKKLGRDEATGLDMFSYRYKGDPKTYPKVVGPMAQDIEKKYPGAVREMAGHKAVDMNMLHAMMGIT